MIGEYEFEAVPLSEGFELASAGEGEWEGEFGRGRLPFARGLRASPWRARRIFRARYPLVVRDFGRAYNVDTCCGPCSSEAAYGDDRGGRDQGFETLEFEGAPLGEFGQYEFGEYEVPLSEFEFEEEAYRSDLAYGSWIQSSLNRILGAGLAVDGIVGPQTHTAIRTFQMRQGVGVDGIVGPITEAALIRAGGGPPPARGGARSRPLAAPNFVPAPVLPPPSTPGKRYTSNPYEVPVTRTPASPADLVAMLRRTWPGLNETGARTLVAQYMFETGGGAHCYNWNLGNMKSPHDNVPHMYLANTWECFAQADADRHIANGKGLARYATAEQMKSHAWKCDQPKRVVIYDPPHPVARFRAFASLDEGAQKWRDKHRGIAGKQPNYLGALNAGDIPAVAHILRNDGYYTGSEAGYAAGMRTQKAKVDKALG